MTTLFDHERLDVYRVSLEYVRFIFQVGNRLKGNHRHARDQILRASQSIPLNIAEGNGRRSFKDRRHFFDIARASALECAAVQDVLQISAAISKTENAQGKQMLSRIVAMLLKLANHQTANS